METKINLEVMPYFSHLLDCLEIESGTRIHEGKDYIALERYKHIDRDGYDEGYSLQWHGDPESLRRLATELLVLANDMEDA